MKKVFRYSCSIFGLITVFSLGNFVCYESAMNHFEKMQSAYEARVNSQVNSSVDKKLEQNMKKIKAQEQKSLQASLNNSKLTSDTVYLVQSFDSKEDTTTTQYQALPSNMIGNTRADVEKFCQEYIQNMSADEFLEGLQNMEIVSFSPERLVVKKTYDVSKVKYRYYLIASEGEVVVYYGDKKTVYEKTGIKTSKLTKKDRLELKNGIEVKDEDELFSILENYSS